MDRRVNVPDLGPEGAGRATCSTCRAALITAFTHIGTHRMGTQRVDLACPACGAPDAVTVSTARRGGLVGTAEVYRALLAPPWVRARLPPTYEEAPVLRGLLSPWAFLPLLAAVGGVALWARESGWVNVKPVLLGVLGGGAVFAGGLRLLGTERLTAWRKSAAWRENLVVAAVCALALGLMIVIVLATG